MLQTVIFTPDTSEYTIYFNPPAQPCPIQGACIRYIAVPLGNSLVGEGLILKRCIVGGVSL